MKLTFGVDEFDQLLNGFELGQFVVLYGSRLSHVLSELLCVRVQLSTKLGGLNSSAIFVDGGNIFDPYALSFFSRLHNLDPREALEKVYVSRAFTAYQLTSLVFEKIQEALEEFESKLVVVSDISGLFLDRDVPETEARDIFNSVTVYLSDFASKNEAIVLATHCPHIASRRSMFMESALHGRANVLVQLQERRDVLRFVLEKHPTIDAGYAEVSLNSFGNAITLREFFEV